MAHTTSQRRRETARPAAPATRRASTATAAPPPPRSKPAAPPPPSTAASASSAVSKNAATDGARAEAEILFQKYFKSVGPRTYAAQIKRAQNGNHFLVLTEGKRDEKNGELKKIRLFVFSEDFGQFFRMLHETAQFIKANPVSEEVRKKRERFWAKKAAEGENDLPAPISPMRPSSAAPPPRDVTTAGKAPIARPTAAPSRPRPTAKPARNGRSR